MFTISLFNQLMSKGLPFAVGLVPARKQARLSSWSSWLTHAHEMNIFYVLQWRFFTHIWICTLCMTFVCLYSTVTYFYFNMLFEFRSINADICPGTHVSIPSSVNIFWMVNLWGLFFSLTTGMWTACTDSLKEIIREPTFHSYKSATTQWPMKQT